MNNSLDITKPVVAVQFAGLLRSYQNHNLLINESEFY
jgi:hypothetical protein